MTVEFIFLKLVVNIVYLNHLGFMRVSALVRASVMPRKGRYIAQLTRGADLELVRKSFNTARLFIFVEIEHVADYSHAHTSIKEPGEQIMASKISNIFIGLILVLCCVSTAFALPSVTISQTANGVYTVQGSNMDGVAGIQLDVS